MGAVLVACGIVAVLLAGWASYGNARVAIAACLHEGDPTRAAIEAARPITARLASGPPRGTSPWPLAGSASPCTACGWRPRGSVAG